jgi:hypothetical protein
MEGETITHKYTLTGSYEVKNSSLEWWSSKTTTTQTVVMQTLSIYQSLLKRVPALEILVVLFCWCKQSKYWTINGSAKVAKLTKPVES